MGKSLWKQTRWAAPMVGIALGTVVTAYAGLQSNVILQSNLYGNIPNVTVRGVQAGGAPWVVEGTVKLTRTDLVASGKWLIIPKTGYLANGKPIPSAVAGTTAGVTSVVAAITFANAPTIVTAPVSLNKQGNFTFNVMLNIPKNAANPVVLIGPGTKGKIGAWFASSDFLMDYGEYQPAGMNGMGNSGSTGSSGGGSSSGSGSGAGSGGGW